MLLRDDDRSAISRRQAETYCIIGEKQASTNKKHPFRKCLHGHEIGCKFLPWQEIDSISQFTGFSDFRNKTWQNDSFCRFCGRQLPVWRSSGQPVRQVKKCHQIERVVVQDGIHVAFETGSHVLGIDAWDGVAGDIRTA